MLHKSCSIEEVIARIIRNTRIQDSSFILDFNEWIPEAMNHMKTRYDLKESFADVNVVYHKGKLPCDLVWLEAVEFEGVRLGKSLTAKHHATGHNIHGASDPIVNTPLFSSIITVSHNQTYFDEDNLMYHSDIQPLEGSTLDPECVQQPSKYYDIEMDYIVTSFSKGTVRLHYRARPSDQNGLPLIPDNENYKEAIYNYVRAKMQGAGYKDTVYREEELMRRFEMYAARAIGEITYPTPDEAEASMNMVRFIPPANYWENFFRVDNPERVY